LTCFLGSGWAMLSATGRASPAPPRPAPGAGPRAQPAAAASVDDADKRSSRGCLAILWRRLRRPDSGSRLTISGCESTTAELPDAAIRLAVANLCGMYPRLLTVHARLAVTVGIPVVVLCIPAAVLGIPVVYCASVVVLCIPVVVLCIPVAVLGIPAKPGQRDCQPCPVGMHQPASGQAGCTACPAGEERRSRGAINLYRMRAGFQQIPSPAHSCAGACPAGSYSDELASLECQPIHATRRFSRPPARPAAPFANLDAAPAPVWSAQRADQKTRRRLDCQPAGRLYKAYPAVDDCKLCQPAIHSGVGSLGCRPAGGYYCPRPGWTPSPVSGPPWPAGSYDQFSARGDPFLALTSPATPGQATASLYAVLSASLSSPSLSASPCGLPLRRLAPAPRQPVLSMLAAGVIPPIFPHSMTGGGGVGNGRNERMPLIKAEVAVPVYSVLMGQTIEKRSRRHAKN
uniref:Ephrin_rec_like domain-containing protein n=1 Tax=Macrostomum lignano TaxID=282301 RepID=A0A1I8FQG2_9PLAT